MSPISKTWSLLTCRQTFADLPSGDANTCMTLSSRTSQTVGLASGPNASRQYFGAADKYLGSSDRVRSILETSAALALERPTATSKAAGKRRDSGMDRSPRKEDRIPETPTSLWQ